MPEEERTAAHRSRPQQERTEGIVVATLLGAASAARFYAVSRLGERVVADLRQAVYGRLLALGPRFQARTPTGDTLSRLTTDATQIQSAVGSSIPIALRTAVTRWRGCWC